MSVCAVDFSLWKGSRKTMIGWDVYNYVHVQMVHIQELCPHWSEFIGKCTATHLAYGGERAHKDSHYWLYFMLSHTCFWGTSSGLKESAYSSLVRSVSKMSVYAVDFSQTPSGIPRYGLQQARSTKYIFVYALQPQNTPWDINPIVWATIEKLQIYMIAKISYFFSSFLHLMKHWIKRIRIILF